MQLSVPQKHLGPRSFFVCALSINLLLILSIDMYVPALPSMQRAFDVSAAYLNLTVFVFFAFCAVGVVLIIYVVAGFILNFGPMALLLRAGTAAVWAAGFALLAVLWGIFTAVVHRLVKMTVVS